MTTLTLYDRPAQGTAARQNLNGMFERWRRTKRAIGGYHLGSFAIKDRSAAQLADYYNSWLGYKIVETKSGITSYEGVVWQVDLIKNGVNYRRTLNPKYWANRVKVFYTNTAGERREAAWSENTDSSAIYGVMEKAITLGVATSTGATAERDKVLLELAWPRSRNVGSVSVGDPSPLMSGDGLYVTTAGFSTVINWTYRESSSTNDASQQLAALVVAANHVTDRRIETNALSVQTTGSPIPQRIWDMMKVIISHGDASGNIWKGGTYAGPRFVYEQAPTTIDYILRNGALYDNANIKVDPALLDPGFYVRDTGAPSGEQPPGTSNIFDDPQVSYCDEVEFIWPDDLRLKFPGENLSVDILTAQVKGRRGKWQYGTRYGVDSKDYDYGIE